MAVNANLYDGLQGARVEIGTFTLDPASIAAGAVGTATVTVSGAESGDQIFVQPRNLDAGLVVTGAAVTAADTVTVYLYNPTASAVDGGSVTYDYLLVKF